MLSFNQVFKLKCGQWAVQHPCKVETRKQTLGYVVYRGTILAHAPSRMFGSSEITSSRDTLMRYMNKSSMYTAS